MADEQAGYQSYLLRLWRANSGGQPVWRLSLESVQTGTCRSFATLEQLCAFLKEQAGSDPDEAGQPDHPS